MKLILTTICLATVLMSCKNNSKSSDASESTTDSLALVERAKAIHERVITMDTHDDIDVKNFTDSINYSQKLDTQVTIPKMKAGGLDVAWFIVFTAQDSLSDAGYKKAYDNAMSKFEAIHKLVTEFAPDDIELATTSKDVRRIIKSGKKVAMIGIENGYPIGTDIKNVEKFYNLGGRYMSLAHNGHNQLSDSHTGEENGIWLNNGLSNFGKEVIKEMNRLGIMIDVSHPSKEAMRQMIVLSKAPIIASHSAARGLSDVSRNLDDEQLQWMKKNGGVVQTVALADFVNINKTNARNEKFKSIRMAIADSLSIPWYETWDDIKSHLAEDEVMGYISKKNEIIKIADEQVKGSEGYPQPVNVVDFVNQIDYLVEKIGIDHVGISSDFDGGGGIEGWNDASETFNVTLELVKRGYTEEQIAKLWSGNLLRVLDEVQAVADGLK
ncbi:dipeptidase [Flavobacteriaceae bacterium LMO-SS05]